MSNEDLFTPLAISTDDNDDIMRDCIPDHLPSHVRKTCLDWYTSHPHDVAIHKGKLQILASEIYEQSKSKYKSNSSTSTSTAQLVEWDEEGWHYTPPTHWPAAIRRERTALYILAMDAINFCFWPSTETTYEYEHLATSLTAMAQKDHDQQEENLHDAAVSESYFFSAVSMRDMTVKRMKESLMSVLPPNIEQRCELWNQVGNVLLQEFDGSAWNLLQQANGSAVQAVSLLFRQFAGFRDAVVTGTASVFFLKRAQICVGDWQAALAEYWKVNDLDELTTFADYRLPQLLRERGVFVYTEALARRVDAKEEIPASSRAELSVRAATVVAVDQLAACLNQIQSKDSGSHKEAMSWTAVSVDWYLWQVGERLEAAGELKPHHRVRTTFY